jgi:hypothetical protein
MAIVGVWQTQTNRTKFSGTPVNKVARHAEGASQFTNRHKRIVFESTIPASGTSSPRCPRLNDHGEKKSALCRAPRGVMLSSRQAIIARRAVTFPLDRPLGARCARRDWMQTCHADADEQPGVAMQR